MRKLLEVVRVLESSLQLNVGAFDGSSVGVQQVLWAPTSGDVGKTPGFPKRLMAWLKGFGGAVIGLSLGIDLMV